MVGEDAGLGLLGLFRCRVGGRDVRPAPAPRRLIVTVALEPGGLGRESLQGRLWPDAEAAEPAKRLRQSLWRVRRETGARLLAVTPSHVALADGVDVDLRRGERLARPGGRGSGHGRGAGRGGAARSGAAALPAGGGRAGGRPRTWCGRTR
ncbi:hypothetical protein ACQEU6_36805 [Spirillospora sp. CA-108201]